MTSSGFGRAGRHLCQPGEGASCGGCCGLYNVEDRSREALTARLWRQTRTLAATPTTEEAFARAAEALAGAGPPALFPEVRVCPLLGFLDASGSRVGCLAHPLVTGGPDLRDAGVWDATLCAAHQCPSYGWLSGAEADLVRDACGDWYLYGRVVTDVPLVRAVLDLLARALGGQVAPERLRRRPAALAALRRVFEGVEAGARDPAGAGAFRLGPGGSVQDREDPATRLGVAPAPEDRLILHLGWTLADAPALERARARVRGWIATLAEAAEASTT